MSPSHSQRPRASLCLDLAPTGDPWLDEEVERQLEQDTDWQRVVAVGLRARLYQPGPEEAKQLVSALLEGGELALAAQEVDWIRRQRPAQQEQLIELALAAIQALGRELCALVERGDATQASWRARTLQALHRRDELEGVRVLFEQTQWVQSLLDALEPLDVLGRRWAEQAGVIDDLGQDEWLLRASATSPEAWWVQPVPLDDFL